MFRVRTPTRTAGVALHLLVMIAIIWCSPWLVTILLKQLLKPFAFRHSKSAIIQYRQPPHQPKPSQPKKRRSFVCGCIRHSALHALAIAGGLRCKGSGDVGRSFVLAPPRTSEAPPPPLDEETLRDSSDRGCCPLWERRRFLQDLFLFSLTGCHTPKG